MTKQFAIYKGDKLLTIGTSKQCAEALGVKVDTIYYYKSATYQKRGSGKNKRITIELGDGEE